MPTTRQLRFKLYRQFQGEKPGRGDRLRRIHNLPLLLLSRHEIRPGLYFLHYCNQGTLNPQLVKNFPGFGHFVDRNGTGWGWDGTGWGKKHEDWGVSGSFDAMIHVHGFPGFLLLLISCS